MAWSTSAASPPNSAPLVAAERLTTQRPGPAPEGRYVLYWMQQAQRATGNPALTHAIEQANKRHLPVVVAFGLTANYPGANARHYAFMLEGLAEVAAHLKSLGITFVPRFGDPAEVALALAREAALVVCDRGYLRHQRAWRRRVAQAAPCPVTEVETEAVVPVELASNKAETAARTLRPKLRAHLANFPEAPAEPQPHLTAADLGLRGDFDPDRPQDTLRNLAVDRSVAPVATSGGYSAARAGLKNFLAGNLAGYAEQGSDPVQDATSHLSPFLHFGQIGAAEVYRAVAASEAPDSDREAYLEQLVVRRELAVNHCWFRPDDYDAYTCLPDWARRTLAEHAADVRDPLYSPEQLEAAATHDPYWNAAMTDMRQHGRMPNYLRMYWGKKILEWSASPEEAFGTALHLNDKYFLDGRDPNGYANVAWCFGLHDRGWPERSIFGKVRYMNAAGLRRKFRIDEYVQRVMENP